MFQDPPGWTGSGEDLFEELFPLPSLQAGHVEPADVKKQQVTSAGAAPRLYHGYIRGNGSTLRLDRISRCALFNKRCWLSERRMSESSFTPTLREEILLLSLFTGCTVNYWKLIQCCWLILCEDCWAQDAICFTGCWILQCTHQGCKNTQTQVSFILTNSLSHKTEL